MQNGTTYIVRPRIEPGVEAGHDRLHRGRFHPVVGGAGVSRIHRADEGAILDPSDVGRVGSGVEGVLLRGQPGESARCDQVIGQPRPFLVGAVGEDHPIGLRQLGHLQYPGQQCRRGARRRAAGSGCRRRRLGESRRGPGGIAAVVRGVLVVTGGSMTAVTCIISWRSMAGDPEQPSARLCPTRMAVEIRPAPPCAGRFRRQ